MKKIYIGLMIIFFVISSASAKREASNVKKVELINIVNQQQILLQRITKAYLYTNKTNVSSKADKQLKSALKNFYKTYSKIDTSTKNPQIKRIIDFIKKSSKELNGLVKQPHSQKNRKKILKLSEMVLKKSKELESLLKKDLNKNIYEAMEKSNQQQILIEKIATYCKALQLNKNDATLKSKIKATIKEFSANHKELMRNKQNSKTILKKLKEVDRLWRAVNPIYQNEPSTSTIIFDTTTLISKKMKEISRFYMAMKK